MKKTSGSYVRNTTSALRLNKSINLDITNKCTLACERCVRSLYDYEDTKVPGGDMSVDDYLKVLKWFDKIEFCGNVSDPTLHPKLPEFLALADQHNKQCIVHVAASHRPVDWFINAFHANRNAIWHFGIDGLPADSCNYRHRQDGTKLFDLMVAGRDIVKKVVWQYIIFSYNEKDIDTATSLARYLGIEIKFTKSSRFFANDPLKPSEGMYIPRKGFEQALRQRYENQTKVPAI